MGRNLYGDRSGSCGWNAALLARSLTHSLCRRFNDDYLGDYGIPSVLRENKQCRAPRPDDHRRAQLCNSLLATRMGAKYVTSGFAGVSMAAVALIVLPLAHLTVPGEQMTPRKTAGFLIGFVGVVILIGAQAFESTGAAFETAGRIACVLAASCYAVGSIMLRRLPAAHPIGLATVLLIIGATISIPVALAVEGPPPMPSPQILAVLAFLGLIPTAGANFLRVLVVRSAGPVFMSLVNYQVPVWSVVLGGLILGEALPKSLLLAMSLILIGVGLSQYGALQRLFKR